jgi:uncharacterized protein involved in response to NO
MADCGNGGFWLLLGTAVSLQIAQGRSVEELPFLAALFTVVGDQLALLCALDDFDPCKPPCADQAPDGSS